MTSDEDWDRLVGDAETVRRAYSDAPVILGAVKGPKHRLVTCNAAFRAYYPRAVIGRPVEDFAPELRGQGLIDIYDRVYETGEPLTVSDFRVHVDLDGSGQREHFMNISAVPQRKRGGDISGVVFVATDTTDQVVARLAAERRADEMARRYESLRDSATVIQQALLPPAVPVLPGAEIAAAYLVATEGMAVGGDWFDAISDSAGRIVLILGDVVGQGMEAAAVMTQLRAVTRMQLEIDGNIVESLDAVDHFAADVEAASSATLCVARLDPATGEFEYCTAGHPPPLVIGADRAPRYLEPTGAGPLRSGRGFATRTEDLAVGDVVLLYSDGIIDRPGRAPAASSVELAEAAARVLSGEAYPLDTGRPSVERLCSQTVELLVRAPGYSDDVTLLAAQRRSLPPQLHATLHADRNAERTVRARLRAWIDALGADRASRDALESAISAYVANAVEHAYATTIPGDVIVDAVLGSDGRVRAGVSDRGTWKADVTPGANRGRGLSIARTLVPDAVVRHDKSGTTVSLVYRLTKAAHTVADSAAAAGTPIAPPSYTFDVGVSDDGCVVVAGDVDTLAAPTLAEFLAVHSHAGVDPLHIDLSAVTHLGSAGVSVLVEASERAARQRAICRFVAPPGGTAHHVLSLVGLLPITDENEVPNDPPSEVTR
jgi:serine phosphatase RsbU (regulator of sigma subunit)/anti-anti-sigma regulatory factor/anti-sigma regulatory factor (Ser/Thr protein kinase)